MLKEREILNGLAHNPVQFRLGEYYGASIGAGVRLAFNRVHPSVDKRGDFITAAKRIINPLSLPRPIEFDLICHRLAPEITGKDVLDIGSPKLAGLVMAAQNPSTLVLTDIQGDFISPWTKLMNASGYGKRLGKDIFLQREDARKLTIPQNTIDYAYSISVLEHVANDREGNPGDTQAMQQIAKVLRPGGVVTLTVPYDSRGYREEYHNGTIYEREAKLDQANFYQRYYDAQALVERLIRPTGLILEKQVYFAPILPFEEQWNRIPMKAKVPLLPFQGALGYLLINEVSEKQGSGVALRLRKP